MTKSDVKNLKKEMPNKGNTTIRDGFCGIEEMRELKREGFGVENLNVPGRGRCHKITRLKK